MANTPYTTATPQLRQLLNYYSASTNLADNPFRNARSHEDAQYGSSGNSPWEYYREGGGESGVFTEGWRPRQGSILDQVNQQYGANARVVRDGDQWRGEIDYDKLPQTRFGHIGNVVPIEDHMMSRVMDPRRIYNDPVYGRITHRANISRPNAWVGPALMALVGAGMGSIAGAGSGIGTARNVLQMTQGAFNGRWNPMQMAQLALGLGGGSVPGLQSIGRIMSHPALRAAMLANQFTRGSRGGRG